MTRAKTARAVTCLQQVIARARQPLLCDFETSIPQNKLTLLQAIRCRNSRMKLQGEVTELIATNAFQNT
jgi:hypothetical protein